MSHYSASTIIAAQQAEKTYGVPASVTLAQYALESGYGKEMPQGSNNPFGIKAIGSQPFVYSMTREVIKGKSVMIRAKFRKFDDIAEAFEEHAHLLASAPVYKIAMAEWKQHNDIARGVREMARHYATAPDYATVILSIISSQNLHQYDA